MTLTVGSLFSGIGGIDLGLERAGMAVRWQSEIDPYASRVLAKHWPDVPNLGDVTTIDWNSVEHVDLICGGYPCQPFSLAGVRRGEADPRHLWPFFRDAVRHLRPRLVLLENVPGHLSLGFGRVLGDLAGLGYDCEWDCIPAAAVGAPHLRYRVFVVAVRADTTGERRTGEVLTRPDVVDNRLQPSQLREDVPDAGGDQLRHQPVGVGRRSGAPVAGDDGENGTVADTASTRSQRDQHPQPHAAERCRGTWRSDQWEIEPDVGRVAHGVPHRVDRLRSLGNAVVPQVAELIGRRIIEAVQ